MLSMTSNEIRYLIDNCSNHIHLIGDQIHLIYAHKKISRRELKFYIKSFSRMNQLQKVTHFNLANNGFEYDEIFFELLGKLNLQKIKSFNISFNLIKNVLYLPTILCKCEEITYLELANNNVDSYFLKLLLDNPKFSNLSHFGLSSNNIGIEGAKNLASALNCLIRLTNLNLDGCNIKEAGTISIANGIGLCTGLTSLALCNNDIGSHAATKIICQCSQLVSLNLGFNELGYGENEKIEEFESTLNCLTNLTELNLRANNIKKLSGFCKVFKNLKLLDLSENDFYDSDDDENDEINNLVSSLSNNTSLVQLDLSTNDIGPNAAESIVCALVKCTNLYSLDLSENQIDDSVEFIEEYCKNNFPALERLYIDDNKKYDKRYNNDL